MAKLKTLTKEKFTLLYDSFSIVQLAKALDVDENPIIKRANLYGLSKPYGRPYPKEKDKEFVELLKDIIIEALIADGVTDERLREKGYSDEYIKEKRIKYGYVKIISTAEKKAEALKKRIARQAAKLEKLRAKEERKRIREEKRQAKLLSKLAEK